MKNHKAQLIPATFIKRLNRFVSLTKLNNREIQVYLPNTGRLSELALPGAKVLLLPSKGKYPYRILYIYYKKFPVMIDSSFSNILFADLLEKKAIDKLKDYELIKREPEYNNQRFDFLLKDKNNQDLYIELKSCTLAWNHIASFPDAISSRALSHVNSLAESRNGVLVFFILRNNIKSFIPNYHTDFEFYKAVKLNQKKIKLLAYSIDYDDNLNISELNSIPIKIPDVSPVGSYLIILYNSNEKKIETGRLGFLEFRKGYYIYTGSGMNNVFKRIARHKKKGTKKHWHIDYIKEQMKIIADIPIVKDYNIECQLSEWLNNSDGKPIDNFGSSDCDCASHLFYFKNNPLESYKFWDFVYRKRWKI